MAEDEAPQQDALEDILPTEEPTHAAAEPPLGSFQPWHLPRKHHLRKNQWAVSLDRLLDVIPDRKLIKYLCLPGQDLLDVQVLADVCKAKGRRLRYLGFDQSLAT